MNVSLICACKNRNAPLKISLSSWLLFPQISEIIIVDWSSDESLNDLVNLDTRIKIISVPNQKYFNQPEPLNLAASLATGDYILKVDTDYILNPYLNFFENENYFVDENSFVCGQNTVDLGNNPYYKYLFGLLYVSKDNFMKVNGFNECLTKWYASEDHDIMVRLENFGLKKHGINYDHNIIHIPHPDKKRTENFDANDDESNLRNEIKSQLSNNGFSGDELEWQTDYCLSQYHIGVNQEWISKMNNDYIFAQAMSKWNVTQIRNQLYTAEKS
jgi:hypothetical protein